MSKIKIVVAIIIVAWGCNKDSIDIIPNVRFNAQIDLALPQYNLTNPFIVKPGGFNNVVGVNGVVVYKVTPTEFNAFDLMCTHQHNTPGYFYTEMGDNDGYMVCPECGSQFEIISEFGSVVEGPAQWALKKYQTSLSGSILSIWN